MGGRFIYEKQVTKDIDMLNYDYSYIPITAISVESGESVVDGSTAGAPIAVPEEGLAISGGTLYGIDKTWFANVNPDKGKIYLAISIPSGVTEINNDGLKDSYTSDKKLHDAVTYMDGLGSFSVAALSFDDATGLETIGEQALQGNSQLTGILDLSATNVSVIKKSAFSGCSNLTGVVLPKTLKELGSRSSSAGSVFNGCEGLRYIRVAVVVTRMRFLNCRRALPILEGRHLRTVLLPMWMQR